MPNLYVDHVNGDNNSTIYIHDAELRNTLGQANGIATLDSTGKLPTSQLPNSVNNKLEASTLASENETEATTTATMAHAKDSKFYLEATGEYCMAKTAIAIGDTLVKDTNYQVITINGFLTSLESYLILAGQTLDTKADKVTNATNGNLAGLNGSGNLTDSGWNGAKDTTSISGNPISISGLKSNQLAINPIITFEPIQAGSGTPSPSNIRAISGYDKIEVLSCGVNVWDEEWINGELNSDGTIYVTSNSICSKNFNRCSSNTNYYFKNCQNVAFYDASQTFISRSGSMNQIITTPANACYFKIDLRQVTTYANNMCVNVSNPDINGQYFPHHKTTSISESLGQTVYGLTHEVRTGKAKVTYKSVDLGNLDYSYRGDIVVGVFSNAAVSDYKLAHTVKALCEKYNFFGTVPAVQSMADVPDKSFALYYQTGSTATALYIKDTSYDNATTFKASLSGVKLVYELATPIEIQLTPHEISLLKDYAYVSTNGTSISLDYHNGELASLADVSQLGETLNELGNSLNKNDFGQIVSIKTYTSSNMYKFPTDGYLYIRCNASGSKLFVVIQGSTASTGIYIELEYGTQASSTSLYVKKGMRTYVYSGTGDYSYSFVPLV